MISIVIPAYNEEAGIDEVLESILSLTDEHSKLKEIIVVNDGSEDATAETVSEYDVKLITHPENKGYGASLKTGIQAADQEYVLIIDADGTYPVDAIPELIEYTGEYDMVVGARVGENVHIPTYRRPAKWFLSALANYLSDSDIPDLNSGLRLFRKEYAMELFHILPSGFSFTTTITLAYHTSDLLVKYIPIDYHERKGDSKIDPIRDGFNFVVLIIRTMTYFKPLRIFLPLGLVLLFLAIGVFMATPILGQFMDVTTVLLSVAGIQTILYGLLADLVVRRSLR